VERKQNLDYLVRLDKVAQSELRYVTDPKLNYEELGVLCNQMIYKSTLFRDNWINLDDDQPPDREGIRYGL
jgi:hypothetical protein